MSSPTSPIVILEVGTTRTVCLVGRLSADRQMDVIGVGTCSTTGVRKGEVTELKYAVSSARSAIDAASKSARCDIRTLGLVFSGGDTTVMPSMGHVLITGRQPAVDLSAIDEASGLARAGGLVEDRTTLHSVVCNYVLDDTRVVLNPEGLPAKKLSVNMLMVHTATQNLEAMHNVAEDAQVVVSNCVFSALCAGVAALSPEQKRAGVLLVHLGGGTTTYLAYADEAIAAAGSFGVGGDHVTNDVVQAFHLSSVKTAEWLKINQGSAVLDNTAATDRATIPANATLGAVERSFSLRALHTVINARLDETFKILRATMDQHGILSKLGAGVVLTGGGAYQRGITHLVGRIFEAPCTLGTLPSLGVIKDPQPASFAAAYGALLVTARELADDQSRRPRWWFGLSKKGRDR